MISKNNLKLCLYRRLRVGSNPQLCITQDREPNTLPSELFWTPTDLSESDWTTSIRGRTYTKKLRFFTQKKSRLRKSENAVRLLYAKNSDLTHQNAFSLFVFLHPAEKVCRALAVGLNILDFPRPLPLPSPSHPGEGMLVPALQWHS